ncbi:MAG: hypothetical protein ACMUIU_05995 [bacterium]
MKRNRQGFTPLMSHKLNRYHKRICIILLFVFFVLFCLDGIAYVHCKSIFPDEIMDIHGSILSSILRIEQPVSCETGNEPISFPVTGIYISCILIAYTLKRCFPVNNYHLLDSKERLFTFHRYNS